MCREKRSKQQARGRTEVAVIPMPATAAANDYNNDAFDSSCEKADAESTSDQANKDNLYCNWQQLPSAADAGAVGGVDDENNEYEQFEMYESLQNDPGCTTEDPTVYEVIKPKRPVPRSKPPKPH